MCLYEGGNVRIVNEVSVGLLASWCFCDGMVFTVTTRLVQEQADVAFNWLFGRDGLFLLQNCCFLILFL